MKMETEQTRRDPGIAAVLSFFVTGLGQTATEASRKEMES